MQPPPRPSQLVFQVSDQEFLWPQPQLLLLLFLLPPPVQPPMATITSELWPPHMATYSSCLLRHLRPQLWLTAMQQSPAPKAITASSIPDPGFLAATAPILILLAATATAPPNTPILTAAPCPAS